MVAAQRLIDLAYRQVGDRYVFGAEASAGDPDPRVFDCSELVEWVCARLAVAPRVPDGSWIQWRHCRAHGTLISVAEGLRTPGALLFRFSGGNPAKRRPRFAHVAFSLGDGRTVEARGSAYGVGVFSAQGRGWTDAGRIPGVDYRQVRSPSITAPAPKPPRVDEGLVARVLAAFARASRQTLRLGSRGDAVKVAQRLLAAAGFDPGPADGVFGPRTSRAVCRFQAAHGLRADGIVGPRTWAALLRR